MKLLNPFVVIVVVGRVQWSFRGKRKQTISVACCGTSAMENCIDNCKQAVNLGVFNGKEHLQTLLMMSSFVTTCKNSGYKLVLLEKLLVWVQATCLHDNAFWIQGNQRIDRFSQDKTWTFNDSLKWPSFFFMVFNKAIRFKWKIPGQTTFSTPEPDTKGKIFHIFLMMIPDFKKLKLRNFYKYTSYLNLRR